MRTQVASTSVDAFYALGHKRGSQQARIIDLLSNHPGDTWTRNEIAAQLDMRLSSVCARCNELVTLEILTEGPRRPCSITGIAAHPLTLTPAQGALFS